MSYTEDPVFEILQKIRSDGELQRLLADSWKSWSGHLPRVIRTEPGTIDYRPFERAWAMVKAIVTPHSGEAVGLDIVLHVFALEETAERAADASRQLPVLPCNGPPMFVHDSWNLVGWTLPNGPDLRELGCLLRADALCKLVEIGGAGYPDPRQYCGPTLHWYAPSKGALVRWRHRNNDIPVFAKLVDHESSMAAYSNLAKVHAANRRGELAFRSPVPIGHCPELHTYLATGLKGDTLTDLIPTGSVSAFVDTGRALASLHRSSISPSSFWSAERQSVGLARGMNAICYALPELVSRLTNVLDSVSKVSVDIENSATTPIHGNPSCDEIRFGNDRVQSADWDGLALGDPFHDVGCLTAHVAHLVGRGTVAPARALDCIEAFGFGYREVSGLSLEAERVAWHFAVSSLRHGKLRSLQSLADGWTDHIRFAIDEADRALAGTSPYVRALQPCGSDDKYHQAGRLTLVRSPI